MKLYITSLLFLLTTSLGRSTVVNGSNNVVVDTAQLELLKSEFFAWAAQHDKPYLSEDEEEANLRFGIWMDNYGTL
jgi:hypothetical protein